MCYLQNPDKPIRCYTSFLNIGGAKCNKFFLPYYLYMLSTTELLEISLSLKDLGFICHLLSSNGLITQKEWLLPPATLVQSA